MSSAIKFSCKICENNVTNSEQAIQCDLCNSWDHIKCNDVNYIEYKFLQNSNVLGLVSHSATKFSLSIL